MSDPAIKGKVKQAFFTPNMPATEQEMEALAQEIFAANAAICCVDMDREIPSLKLCRKVAEEIAEAAAGDGEYQRHPPKPPQMIDEVEPRTRKEEAK